jgi:hypothetical protein
MKKKKKITIVMLKVKTKPLISQWLTVVLLEKNKNIKKKGPTKN